MLSEGEKPNRDHDGDCVGDGFVHGVGHGANQGVGHGVNHCISAVISHHYN